MSVYNAVGEGPLSPPQEVFVGEAGECTLVSLRYEFQGPHSSLATSSSIANALEHSLAQPPCLPVPTAAPQNVVIHSATATQLDVTWEPPPLDSQNGDIQGYKVEVTWQRNGVQRVKGVGVGW